MSRPQVQVFGTATAALREFASGIGLPQLEWPWTQGRTTRVCGRV